MRKRRTANEKLPDRVNTIKLTQKDMIRVVKRIDKEHKRSSDNELLAIRATTEIFFREPDKARAVYYRLMALVKLMKHNGLKGWTLADEGDAAT